MPPCAAAGAGSEASSLSSSPERPAVHFDLAAEGGGEGGRPLFKRSLSMAELAAAELVRQEEVGLETRESLDGPALAGVAAGMRQGSRRDSFSGGRSV